MKKFKILIILGFILVSAACSKPPEQEMADAQAAVDRAKADPDVRLYAPGSLTRAQESLNNMSAAAEQKLYDQAKQLALDTISLAEKAITDGRQAAIRAKDDAQTAITQMLQAVDETDTAISGAKKARQKGLDFNELDSEFAQAKTGAQEAENANASARYKDAIDGARNVRSQLSNITAKIGQGTLAQSRKK